MSCITAYKAFFLHFLGEFVSALGLMDDVRGVTKRWSEVPSAVVFFFSVLSKARKCRFHPRRPVPE